jgi:hypothetical protein
MKQMIVEKRYGIYDAARGYIISNFFRFEETAESHLEKICNQECFAHGKFQLVCIDVTYLVDGDPLPER